MANEKRLIDANALLRTSTFDIGWGSQCQDCEWIYRKAVMEAPTVDAVEVVHGEWEISQDDFLALVELKCSVCGEAYGFEYFEDDAPLNYRYCPNCGAKMDGE